MKVLVDLRNTSYGELIRWRDAYIVSGPERRTLAAMRKAGAVLVAAVVFAACAARPHTRKADDCPGPRMELKRAPALGDVLAIREDSRCSIVAASAQTWPSYTIVAGGVHFTAGIDGDQRVRFLSTSDPAFVTPEGLRAGDSASKAIAAAGSPVMIERGWGHYVELGSGWSAAIDDTTIDTSGRLDVNLGTRDLRSDAQVAMFFQRN